MIAFLLAVIPGLIAPTLTFLTAMKNVQVQIFQARTGHAADVALAAIQGQAAVQTKWWFAALPPAIIGFVIAFYVAKAIGWDVVVGSFSGCAGAPASDPTCHRWFETDALKGDLHMVFLVVITGYFSVSLVDKFLKAK